MKVQIVRLKHGKDLPLPRYQTPGSAGMDLMAAVDEDFVLQPGEFRAIPTGVAFSIPKGYKIDVRARSGLAAKYGIGMVNGVGTIDSDYRGELMAILINYSKQPFTIHRGDRVAQAVLGCYERMELEEVDELDETERGSGAFGSTGIKP